MSRSCPFDLCDGSGHLIDESTDTAHDCRCRPQIVNRARALSLAASIPRRYRGSSFERPPVTAIEPRAVVRVVEDFANSIDARLDGGDGLWLLGPNGTGKTTLAMLVSKAALDAGRTVAIYSLPRLLAEIRTTYDDGSDRSYLNLIDRLTDVDLLHIDDVGAEKTSPWVLEQLYTIVNSRYEEERSIVFTTNIEDLDELREQVNRRTVSRLMEMCEQFQLAGHDRREDHDPQGWAEAS